MMIIKVQATGRLKMLARKRLSILGDRNDEEEVTLTPAHLRLSSSALSPTCHFMSKLHEVLVGVANAIKLFKSN
jgi:hypothetical protein